MQDNTAKNRNPFETILYSPNSKNYVSLIIAIQLGKSHVQNVKVTL